MAAEWIECRVYPAPPRGLSGYALPAPKTPCWWVIAGPVSPNLLDGPPRSLYCVSRKSGRIIGRGLVREGG